MKVLTPSARTIYDIGAEVGMQDEELSLDEFTAILRR
jgi:hypothetical protein